MDANLSELAVAAVFGVFWVLVLGVLVAFRAYAERSPFRPRREP